MNKKEVLELKKRLTKNACTFTKLSGCYVNADKERVLTFNETFLNLEDEEFFKYIEIAKKVLSGNIDNNLLTLEFPSEEEDVGGHQRLLMGIRESKLKNAELLEPLYDNIIASYEFTGNYLILLFHDAYDVITRANDNAKLDESEEVYEYLLCAICPVALSKPGLSYRPEEERIGARVRDWVVGDPENGFLFPAFNERSTDIHSILYYTKNTKEPRPEFVSTALGCDPKRTVTEQKEIFSSIIRTAVGIDDEQGDNVIYEIHSGINEMIEEHEERTSDDVEPIVLTPDTIAEVISETKVPTEIASKIKKAYEDEFGEMPPIADNLVDTKSLAAMAQKHKETELLLEVAELKQQLKETSENLIDGSADDLITYDVILKVNPDKVPQIKSQVIDGKKCLIIPMEEDEEAFVNGVNTEL